MTIITRGVVESYIACRYKAYLTLTGHDAETGHESEPLAKRKSKQTPSLLDQVSPLQNRRKEISLTELMPKPLRKGNP
jgi:hypothetical protein